MQRFKSDRLAIQGISAVLLCGVAFAASAEQMMKALPAPVVAQPVAALPAVQQPAAAMQPIAAPAAVVAPAAISPVAIPAGQPTKPMSQTSPSAAPPMSQMKLAPPSQSGGMAQLNSAAVCGLNTTPRIININGTQSSIVFQPGSQLNIAGCGFGKNGRAQLSGGEAAVLLRIDSWEDSNIHAHIDAALGGLSDLSRVNLTIYPNDGPVIYLPVTHSFHAARETIRVAPPPGLGVYSQLYGAPKMGVAPDGKSTTIERNATFTPFCPSVTDQSQMVDIWPIDSEFFKLGFEVVGVDYKNMTNQVQNDNLVEQMVLVGQNGGANYEASTKRIVVTFQGHSSYAKKQVTVGDDGYSTCTSRYSVSLIATGPRGIDPYKPRQ